MNVHLLKSLEGFDWDDGNIEKNKKHNVDWRDIEETFLGSRVLISEDEKHSEREARYLAYGKTNKGRILTIVFTVRKNKIRPISARDANKKEKMKYEEKES